MLFPDLSMHPACRNGPTEDRCLTWGLYEEEASYNVEPILAASTDDVLACGKVILLLHGRGAIYAVFIFSNLRLHHRGWFRTHNLLIFGKHLNHLANCLGALQEDNCLPKLLI